MTLSFAAKTQVTYEGDCILSIFSRRRSEKKMRLLPSQCSIYRRSINGIADWRENRHKT